MLVGGHTCGQDLWNDRVSNNREAEIDRTGCRGVLQVIHFAEGEHKGKDAILVVEQDLT